MLRLVWHTLNLVVVFFTTPLFMAYKVLKFKVFVTKLSYITFNIFLHEYVYKCHFYDAVRFLLILWATVVKV